MARTTKPVEIEILSFFETGPIDKAEAVFNIVSEKLRQRRRREGTDVPAEHEAHSTRRQRRKTEEGERSTADPVP